MGAFVMSRFALTNFAQGYFGSSESPDVVPRGQDSRKPWTLFDGSNLYFFEVNPLEASMPTPKKKFSYKSTASGRIVEIEGKPETQIIELSGKILSEKQYRDLLFWSKKRTQVRVTDDLEQSYWVYFKSFSPQRVKNPKNPWTMDYTLSGVLLDRG